VKERKMLSEAPARRAVVALLNKLLGVSEESKEFWKLDLSHELQRKFKLWNNPDLKAEYANNGVFPGGAASNYEACHPNTNPPIDVTSFYRAIQRNENRTTPKEECVISKLKCLFLT
jgi:hypothetical protein